MTARRASILDVIERRRPAHELRDDLATLWADGFRAGADLARERAALTIAALEHDVNYWYWRAVDPEAHAARMREIISDFDAQTARNEIAKRWAAIDAAEREQSDAC